MRKHRAFILLAVVGAALIALFVARLAPGSSTASSHREAPLISEDPTADNTDLYAFRSPDKPSTFTIVSNWIPGEDPAAARLAGDEEHVAHLRKIGRRRAAGALGDQSILRAAHGRRDRRRQTVLSGIGAKLFSGERNPRRVF